MLKKLISTTLDWGWKPRILFSALLASYSAFTFLNFGGATPTAYAVIAFLLLSPFLFKEKEPTFGEGSVDELVMVSFMLDNDALHGVLNFLMTLAQTGFDEDKLNAVVGYVKDLSHGEQRIFNYYLVAVQTRSSLGIKVRNQGDVNAVDFTSNQALSTMLHNYMERDIG